MKILGTWAVANIGVGAIGWANSKGGENKYFYKMTTIWGAGNLAAATLGFLQANGKSYNISPSESLAEQRKIETTFIINTAIDVVNVAAGAYIKHRGDVHNYAQLKGYGSAMLIQSVFLLAFDGSMYAVQRQNGNKIRHFLEKNPITFNGKSVGMIFTM